MVFVHSVLNNIKLHEAVNGKDFVHVPENNFSLSFRTRGSTLGLSTGTEMFRYMMDVYLMY